MTGYATARQNGWMSANDIRELENMDRIPAEEGGDLYLINGNMLPLGNAGAFANTEVSDDGKEEDSDEEVLEVEEPGGDGNGSGSEDAVLYYEHLRADNIEAFSKERNDEYVGRAEEYKAAKSALLEGLGLEHLLSLIHIYWSAH